MGKIKKVLFCVKGKQTIIINVDDYTTTQKILKFRQGLAFEFSVEEADISLTWISLSEEVKEIVISVIVTWAKKETWN